MRKTLLFENVNGNSKYVEEVLWERFRLIGNVSIKFLPLRKWQNGLCLRVGGQPREIDFFIQHLHLKGTKYFFRMLDNVKISDRDKENKDWVKIPI